MSSQPQATPKATSGWKAILKRAWPTIRILLSVALLWKATSGIDWHALLDSEILRMSELAKSASHRTEALFLLSRDIYENSALRKVAELEPHLIARMVTISESEKWSQVRSTLQSVLYCSRESGELVLRWLLSQFFSPIPEGARRAAVEKIESSLSL